MLLGNPGKSLNLRVEVICVGSELLAGKVNTHVAYLSEQLSAIGLSISREHTVGDEPALMAETFREAHRRADIVLCAGGLGPTFDDITRDVWSKVLGRRLEFRAALAEEIREKFARRGIRMPPLNRRQAFVLKGAEAVDNPHGTAPGQVLEAGKKILVLLPGPARELYPMMEEFVLPRLRRLCRGLQVARKSFHLVGVPESKIDQKIRPIVSRHKKVRGCPVVFGILASQSIITVKYQVKGPDAARVRQASDFLAGMIRRRLGTVLFGEDEDTLEGVIGSGLTKKRKTLAVAESCTGGLISKMITDQAGSSHYFLEGITTYADRSKVARLGVRPETLKRHGAVSPQTAREMATGLRQRSGADYTLSVTGIAGPEGGTPEKPVGRVYVGCASPRRVRVQEFNFTGDRAWIRHRAALMALDILRRELRA